MVTLYELGVELNFLVGNSNKKVVCMAESSKEMEALESNDISFREYENVALEFISLKKSDRIYFDGIDLLPESICNIDEEGEMYLSPQKKGECYSIFEHTSEYYAMRVGKYELRLCHDDKIYYQWFTVLPKNMQEQEWDIMQHELEKEMQGLSSDIIRKNISLGKEKTENIPSQDLYKFFVIKKHFHSILAALIDLQSKPNYKLQKEYKLESLHHATYIDSVTIKDYLRKGTGEEKYFVPNRFYNYDLPENRWLKKIIGIYENELQSFKAATTKYRTTLQSEIQELYKYKNKNIAMIRSKENVLIELEHYLETAKTILSVSELIKGQDWYQQIKPVKSLVIPHVLIYDVRYNAFYKMYKELQQNKTSIHWNERYSYSWKLSSKMYEVWCFIKICRFLISDEIDFEAQGWVFDELKKEHMLIPELLSGTKVEFSKDDMKIKLYYDTVLPGGMKDTNKETKPIYASTEHKRPDIRMDLYKNEIFWSSLIFEIKYRNLENIWYKKEFSCKEQIRAYKNNLKSVFTKVSSPKNPEYIARKFLPVDRVWVLNPTHSKDDVIDRRDEGIKFVQLIPGEEHNSIIKELREEIDMAFDGELA